METFLTIVAIWAIFDYAVVNPIRKEEITENENK